MCYSVPMKISSRFRRLFYILVDFFPSRLPVGLTAFYAWTDRLKFTYFPSGAAPPDDASFQFSISAMIMHLDSQSAKKPNRFFGKAIYKGAANEVASFVMHDLKAKRDAQIKADEDAAKLRAQLASTPTEEVDATTPQASSEARH